LTFAIRSAKSTLSSDGIVSPTWIFLSEKSRSAWEQTKETSSDLADQAGKLYDDAQVLLERIITSKRIRARGVYGFFPANSAGDDIIVWSDDSRTRERARLHSLRQQTRKSSGKPNLALADYIAPRGGALQAKSPDAQFITKSTTGSHTPDYVGGFVVGIHGADEWARELEDLEHDPYQSIMIKALADRLAEAFAELLHHRARVAWGIERPNQFNHNELIKEIYQGIRPAPGYPSQPDHTEKPILFDLLDAPGHTGIVLTESMAMHPAASVSGLFFAHPDAKYFAVGKLDRDQIEDYARRKGLSIAETEKWLAPNLGYERGR